MAEILKGKPVADAIKEELTQKTVQLKARGYAPKLAIIRVGVRADDLFYENGIKKTCATINMDYEIFEQPENIDQNSFEKKIK